MKAKVTHLNSKLGYYSATTDRNKVVFTLVEAAPVKVGDILEGDVENRGVQLVLNETQNIQIKVDIKELHSLAAPFRGHG
jgi:CxxC motif-containing protein